eukprot:TRINITY_DN1099_c0_g1_i3.p1 TRINITY_DN1099_c0_g1~~TRINITY_DN1099_c0_g1_i3.p1  ORF type:complete len:495 (+),score=117.97 TRINITY_DN1099_c0_g1_i3:716-2200(+)
MWICGQNPDVWHGIGILYDRMDNPSYALDAFVHVLRLNPSPEKRADTLYRIGVIKKYTQEFDKALACFEAVLARPSRSVDTIDVKIHMAQVLDLLSNKQRAKKLYEEILEARPDHAKALQQLGWIHQQSSDPEERELAISYLTKSAEFVPDAETWYMLGRAYMSKRDFSKAYDAYRNAVGIDSTNAVIWCSVGVLFFEMERYRDALEAYTRAIHLNPRFSEVWFDLGTLYEACQQIRDALDAYKRAAELDQDNKEVQMRIEMLTRQMHSISKGNGEESASQSQPQPSKTCDPVEPSATYVMLPPQSGPPLVPAPEIQGLKASVGTMGGGGDSAFSQTLPPLVQTSSAPNPLQRPIVRLFDTSAPVVVKPISESAPAPVATAIAVPVAVPTTTATTVAASSGTTAAAPQMATVPVSVPIPKRRREEADKADKRREDEGMSKKIKKADIEAPRPVPLPPAPATEVGKEESHVQSQEQQSEEQQPEEQPQEVEKEKS